MDTILSSDPQSGEVKIIEYKNKKIIYQNFSTCNPAQCLKVIEEGRKIFDIQPKNSVLSLVDVRKTDFDTSVVEGLKKYATDNKPYSIKCAVVGIEGLKKIILQAVVKITGRDFMLFNDVASAKNALIKD